MRVFKYLIYTSITMFLCMCTVSGSKGNQESGQPDQKGQTFRVQVEMVSLPVVVTDDFGNHVRNLRREDFVVLENGVPQEIAGFATVEEPISIALMLDVSGSTETQLGRIKDEAIRFVDILRSGDSVAILSVADQVKVVEQFSIYHEKNPEKIKDLQSGGLSAVYDGVAFALVKVLKEEFGRKALVFFSDGIDNRSENATEEDTLEMARQTEAPIYCIYFDTEKDPMKGSFDPFPLPGRFPPSGTPPRRTRRTESRAGRSYMEKLARISGGLLLDAAHIENLGSAFTRIARELSSQYSIGYYPKNLKKDGQFRQVEVRSVKPGLVVRTRQGYYRVQ